MLSILCISGSAALNGANLELLHSVQKELKEEFLVNVYGGLGSWKLFSPQAPKPKNITELQQMMESADVIIISTPEYVHNIPAALKNLFDWTYESGVWQDKKVIPISFTPKAPRGNYALISLKNSLEALNANILVEIPLYQDELRNEDGTIELSPDMISFLKDILNGNPY